MPKLGPSLWDDPTYVLGTIEPRGDGVFDLGTPQNRFRNIYLVGDIDLDDAVVESLTLTGSTGVISSDTANAADTKSVAITGAGSGGGVDPERGSYIILDGNEVPSTGGRISMNGGNMATAHIDIGINNAAARFRVLNSTGSFVWAVENDGDLIGSATDGGNIIFAKATSGLQLQSGANGRTGTFTMNGATPVVVGNTSLAAGDMIIIERDTPAGTPGEYNLTARTNSTGFSVTGTALDTSGMRYTLIRVN